MILPSLYIYIYINIYIYIYIYIYICIYIYIYIYIYVYIYIYIYTYIYICMYIIYIYVCVCFFYLCIHSCICLFINSFIYINTHTNHFQYSITLYLVNFRSSIEKPDLYNLWPNSLLAQSICQSKLILKKIKVIVW